MTCGSNSNMGSIAKAMKDALEHRLFYRSISVGRDIFLSAPTGAGKRLTF